MVYNYIPMIPYPDIDPEIVRVGPLAIRWYSLMYLIGFTASYFLVQYQIRKKKLAIPEDHVSSLYTYLILGLILGARIGYVLFYNPGHYLHNPSEIIAVWHGGLSFHGGLIGCLASGIIFCRKYRHDFWQMADLVIVTAPIGLGFGRIGNFINAELYGRVTDVPWGMIFPGGGPLPRHPSQLYESFLEGGVLFIIMWILKNRPFRTGKLTAIFLMCYGVFRFIVEFFREPDAQLGFVAGIFSMGQVLSSLMFLAGFLIAVLRSKK